MIPLLHKNGVPIYMHSKVKICISAFFLFLFLLPTIEKGIHSHHHLAESHCTGGNHFHVQEFHCLICDFTSTDSNSPILVNYSNLIFQVYFLFHPFTENNFTQDAVLHLPSRAPPVV